MAVYISMLRGINVGGNAKISMADLKALYESLGFTQVQTHIQSGNVVMAYDGEPARLVNMIEKALQRRFGFDVKVVVRTVKGLETSIRNNPFPGREGALHMTFLSEKPVRTADNDINRVKSPGEEICVKGTEVYILCPDGYGRTKLSNNFLERKLGVVATTRNWKTVHALLAMAKSVAPAQD
jgi:uncharacterized protein (DUF1697 family)